MTGRTVYRGFILGIRDCLVISVANDLCVWVQSNICDSDGFNDFYD